MVVCRVAGLLMTMEESVAKIGLKYTNRWFGHGGWRKIFAPALQSGMGLL
jgi:hypothetical protein